VAQGPRLTINMCDARARWSIPDWAVAEIRQAAPQHLEVTVVSAPADGRGDGGSGSAEAIEAIVGAEIYLGFGLPRELFDAASRSGNLRWVHSGSAGIGGALQSPIVDSSVLLTNSAGIHAEPIADSVMAMLHYFARGLDFAVHAQRDRRWWKEPFDSLESPVREISGSTLGIVGYGGIGQAVSRRARSLGMRILAFRRHRKFAEPGVEILLGDSGLDRLLCDSHFVVLCLPRTAQTERILDRRRIGLLRRDAVIVNVGRGELVEEDALSDALGSNRIRGAAIDVFVREPLPTDSSLWALPNALITPHVSATTDRFWRREVDLIVENLARYSRGETLLNLVDKRAGY
jgi:phosphoglycerate dehydrogenase-like enzyme